MKNPTLFCLVLTASTLLPAQDQASPAPGMKFSFVDPSDPAVVAFRRPGDYALEYVANKFMFEINRELSSKKPEDAVGLMHLKSMALPQSDPGKPVVTDVKLTSLRVRNSANAPDEADAAALDNVRRDLANGRRPASLIVQKIDHGSGHPDEWRFYRPIATAQSCLACHGDDETVSPAVKEKLSELYPDDKATDYRAHQWRGVIRISLTAAPAS